MWASPGQGPADNFGSTVAPETAGLSLLICKMETSKFPLLPSLGLFILQTTTTTGQTPVASAVPAAPALGLCSSARESNTCRELQLDREDASMFWGTGLGSWYVKAL